MCMCRDTIQVVFTHVYVEGVGTQYRLYHRGLSTYTENTHLYIRTLATLYSCICIYVYIHMYIYTYVWMYVCVCVCMYVYAYIHTYIYVYIYMYPYISVCIYTHTHTHAYTYIGRHALRTHLREGAVPVLTPERRGLVRVCGRRGRARGAGRLATSVCGLKKLVYGSLSYECMRPQDTSVAELAAQVA